MARNTPSPVDEYIASQPAMVRSRLQEVRGAIRGSVPDAEETISYGMPAYKLHGRIVLFFAGWKHHVSLYPGNARLVAAFAGELTKYKVSKGTIQFPLGDPVPVELIERIATFRAKETAGELKTGAPKKGSRVSRKSTP